MPSPAPTTGRPAQRRRTRSAILAAAAELLAHGKTPSVNEVADAADVSRRTVYMYFPTIEHLLLDATLGAIARTTIDAALEETKDGEEIGARVERIARAIQRGALETEQEGRTLLRLTAYAADAADAERPSEGQRRGYRRVEWIERMLAPLRPRLDRKRFERLVSALVMVLGWEALIVERDVRGLDAEESEALSAWAARALVRAALDEQDATNRRSAAKRPTRR
jgi:AcrR family transcriptional regulator